MVQSGFLQSVKWCVIGAKEVLNSPFMLTQQLSRCFPVYFFGEFHRRCVL